MSERHNPRVVGMMRARSKQILHTSNKTKVRSEDLAHAALESILDVLDDLQRPGPKLTYDQLLETGALIDAWLVHSKTPERRDNERDKLILRAEITAEIMEYFSKHETSVDNVNGRSAIIELSNRWLEEWRKIKNSEKSLEENLDEAIESHLSVDDLRSIETVLGKMIGGSKTLDRHHE